MQMLYKSWCVIVMSVVLYVSRFQRKFVVVNMEARVINESEKWVGLHRLVGHVNKEGSRCCVTIFFHHPTTKALEQVQDESIDIFVNVTVQHSHEVNIQIIKFRMHFYCIDLNHWPGIRWMSRARIA